LGAGCKETNAHSPEVAGSNPVSIVEVSLCLAWSYVFLRSRYNVPHYEPYGGCNVAIVGMKASPAVLITQVKSVTYDWLFSCAKVEILGLGVPVCRSMTGRQTDVQNYYY